MHAWSRHKYTKNDRLFCTFTILGKEHRTLHATLVATMCKTIDLKIMPLIYGCSFSMRGVSMPRENVSFKFWGSEKVCDEKTMAEYQICCCQTRTRMREVSKCTIFIKGELFHHFERCTQTSKYISAIPNKVRVVWSSLSRMANRSPFSDIQTYWCLTCQKPASCDDGHCIRPYPQPFYGLRVWHTLQWTIYLKQNAKRSNYVFFVKKYRLFPLFHWVTRHGHGLYRTPIRV